MKTKTLKLFILALIPLFLVVFLSCKPNQQKHQLTLGLAIPLTGQLAWLGMNLQDGLNFYLDEHPEVKDKLRVITEDVTTTDSSRGVAAIKKLIDIDQIDTMIVTNSGALEGSKQEIDRGKVVTFGIVGTDAMKGMKFGVKHWVTTQAEAKILAEKIQQLNLQRIAIVTSEHQGYINREESLKEALSPLIKNGLSVYSERSTGLEELPTLALKVKQFNPEAVAILLFPGHVGIVAKELQKLGYNGIYLGTVSASDPADIQISDGALKNLLYCDVPLSPEFESAFQAKYGKKPFIGASNGYDIAKILHAALDSGLSYKDRDKLNDFIRVKKFTGSMGTYSFVNDGTNTFDFPMVIKKVSQ